MSCDEDRYLANAAMALGDEHAARKRLDEIEQALKFDPNPEYRRQLRREYLALTDEQKDRAA